MIDVSTNAASVSVRYTDAPKLVATTVVQTFRRIGAGLQRHAVREKLNGQVLERRTGTLARALFSQIWLDGKDAVLTFGADKAKAKGAAIQEYGGTIRPTHAQHLAIPLDAARTAKGVARLSAREFIAHPESLGFESTFVNKRRTAIMGVRGGEAEPVFALKTSVTLPARSYLRSTVDDKRAWILAQLGGDVADALQGQG